MGADRALMAAHAAKLRGASEDAVLDALEAAEAAYAHGNEAATLAGKCCFQLDCTKELFLGLSTGFTSIRRFT